MTLSLVGVGAIVSGTTSVSPAYPSGYSAVANDLAVLVVSTGHSTSTTVPTATNYTQQLSGAHSGSTTTFGADTGPRRITILTRVLASGNTAPTVALGSATGSVMSAQIYIFRNSRTNSPYLFGGSTGTDNSSGTGFSVTAASNPGITTGDIVLTAIAATPDASTFSAINVTTTGVTYGTASSISQAANTNGNQLQHVTQTRPVSSGTSTAAPVTAATMSTAGSGVGAVFRIREGYSAASQTLDLRWSSGVIYTSEIQRDFDSGSLDMTLFANSYGTYSQSGGLARVQSDPGTVNYSGIMTLFRYKLNSLYVKITPAPKADGTGDILTAFWFQNPNLNGNDVGFYIELNLGQIWFAHRVSFFDSGATIITYDPVAHAWVRLIISGSNLLFQTAPDGSTWTTQRTLAAPQWVLDTASGAILMESHRGGGTVQEAQFDNLNMTPVTTSPVSNTVDLRWRSYVTASQTTDLRWRVYTPVSQTTDLRWRSYNTISQTTDLRWRSYVRINNSLDLRWRSYAQVAATVDLRWRSAARVSGTTDLRWRSYTGVSATTDLRWRSYTSVSQTLDLRWRSRTAVLQTVDLRWKSYTAVSQTLDLRWRSAARVSQTLDLRWRNYQTIFAPIQLLWRQSEIVSRVLDLRWKQDGTATQVSQTVDLRWRVAATVSNTVDLRWRSQTAISQTVDLRWKSYNAISQTVDLRWRSIARVTNSLDLRWRSYTRVSQTVDLRWKNYTSVSQTVDLRWRTSSSVQTVMSLQWRVYQPLSTTISLPWRVYAMVPPQALDLRWRSYARVSQTIDLRWKSDSTTLSVSQTLELPWRVYARVSQTNDLRWRSYGRVSATTALRWRVYTKAPARDVQLLWRSYTAISQSVDLRWRSYARLFRDLDLRWRTAAQVSNTVDLRWKVTGKVSADLDLRWRSRQAVSNTVSLTWRQLGRVSASLDLRWRVIGQVYQDLALRWKVEAYGPPPPDVGYVVDIGDPSFNSDSKVLQFQADVLEPITYDRRENKIWVVDRR